MDWLIKAAGHNKEAGLSEIIDWVKRRTDISIPLSVALFLSGAQGANALSELRKAPTSQVARQVVQKATADATRAKPPATPPVKEVSDPLLKGLEPSFAAKVNNVLKGLKERGWQPRVAEGRRTLKQQQEKINTGRSSLKNPQRSKHITGQAADIIDRRYGWKAPQKFWDDLGELAKAQGLIWGGDWKSFKDVAHVQVGDVASAVSPTQKAPTENKPASATVNVEQWVDRVIKQESGGNPNAVSGKGARGLMQIMPATWAEETKMIYGKSLPFDKASDPKICRVVGTHYLKRIQNVLRKWMGKEPTIEQILAAYNGGWGRLKSVNYQWEKMPAESVGYVRGIISHKDSKANKTNGKSQENHRRLH